MDRRGRVRPHGPARAAPASTSCAAATCAGSTAGSPPRPTCAGSASPTSTRRRRPEPHLRARCARCYGGKLAAVVASGFAAEQRELPRDEPGARRPLRLLASGGPHPATSSSRPRRSPPQAARLEFTQQTFPGRVDSIAVGDGRLYYTNGAGSTRPRPAGFAPRARDRSASTDCRRSTGKAPSERRIPPFEYEVGREKIREYASAVGEDNPVHHDPEAARAAGFRNVVAPPMFCVVYSAGAMGPAILDPELGINLMMMVHGGQEFEWFEPVVAGDTITTEATVKDVYDKNGMKFYVFESESKNQDGKTDRQGHLDQHREGRLMADTQSRRAGRRGAGALRHARQVRAAPLRGRVGRLQPDPHRPRVRQGGRACRRTSCTASTRWRRSRAPRRRRAAATRAR